MGLGSTEEWRGGEQGNVQELDLVSNKGVCLPAEAELRELL